MKKGEKKAQSQDGATGSGDVDMNEVFTQEASQEEDQQQVGEQWSLYCTLSPLGENLLRIQVGVNLFHEDISVVKVIFHALL